MVKKPIREKNVAHTIIAVLFSVSLIFGMSGVGLPLQQPQQEAYASSQVQTQAQLPPNQVPQSTQAPPPSDQMPLPPRPICNPNSPTLQPRSAGAKVTELQRALILVGYGSLLGQSGIDGKFGTSTQNAVKKFQQDNRLPVDGKVGPITWGALCNIVPNSFIVQLKSASPSSLRETIGILTAQLAEAGGRVVIVYDQFGMFNVVFEGPLANREQFIKSLRDHPTVQGIFRNKIVTANQVPSSQDLPRGIDRVDADLSAAISGDGRGTVNADIAIIDSGVMRHRDLNVFQCSTFLLLAKVWSNLCYDDNGHGTHVAGIAAAKDNNYGVVGTAPGARIWSIKVMHGSKGQGYDSDVLNALNYVSRYSKDIEVVNLSLGVIGDSSAYIRPIKTLVDIKKIVVVVAAGNENYDAGVTSPAATPAAITVSAITDTNGRCGGAGPATTVSGRGIHHQESAGYRDIENPDDFFASYSNFGSVVDLAAPGSSIESTANTGGTVVYSGTSMAAPHVAGAAALIKSLDPAANAHQVEEFLKRTGTNAPPTGNLLLPCNGSGQGYFNDRYPSPFTAIVATDTVREPLLYMGGIQAPTPALPVP